MPVQGCTFDPVPTIVFAKTPGFCKLIHDIQGELVEPGIVGWHDSPLGFELRMERSGVEVQVTEPIAEQLIHVTVKGVSKIPLQGVIKTLDPNSLVEKPVKLHIPGDATGWRVLGCLVRGRTDEALFKVRECSTVWRMLEALVDAENA